MATDWSALLKAVFGSAYLMSDQIKHPDVVSISGYRRRPSIACRFGNFPPVAHFDSACAVSAVEGAWPCDVTVASRPVADGNAHRQSFTRTSTMTSWNAVPDRCSDKVLGFDEVSQASAPVQTINHSVVSATSEDSSSKVQALVTKAVAAACRQRLQGRSQQSAGSRPVEKATPTRERSRSRQQCPECSDVLATSAVLRRHQLVHSGQQPWSCGHCSAKFSLKFNCSRHCRSKHPELPPFVVPTRTY